MANFGAFLPMIPHLPLNFIQLLVGDCVHWSINHSLKSSQSPPFLLHVVQRVLNFKFQMFCFPHLFCTSLSRVAKIHTCPAYSPPKEDFSSFIWPIAYWKSNSYKHWQQKQRHKDHTNLQQRWHWNNAFQLEKQWNYNALFETYAHPWCSSLSFFEFFSSFISWIESPIIMFWILSYVILTKKSPP